MDQFWEYFSVLAPSIGVFLVFWFVYRAITRADALERETEAEIRQQTDAEPRGDHRDKATETPEETVDENAEQAEPESN